MISKTTFLILLAFCIGQAFGTIFFYKNDNTNDLVHQLYSSDLGMGIPVPAEGIWAYITVAEPENACVAVEPPPAYGSDQYASFALVSNTAPPFYNCSIGEKVDNLADAGFEGAVLYFSDLQNEGEEPQAKWKRLKQDLADQDLPRLYNMTIVFLTGEEGLQVKTKYNSQNGYVAFILHGQQPDEESIFKWKTLKIWAIGIGACLLALLLLAAFKQFLDRRKGSKFV